MDTIRKLRLIRVLVIVTFLGMVVVNALASALPINEQTTGEISDALPNLFAPAGITFAVWGLIYILLAVYCLFQLGLFQTDRGLGRADLFVKIGLYFSLSSLANIAWIFAWHYNAFTISFFLMVVLLASLIGIHLILDKEKLTRKEQFMIRFPFSVYFGWITVATIANVTSLLVSIGWNGFNITEINWTVIIIAVGLVISTATMMRFKDVLYGLTIIWAYLGIWIKHVSADGFAYRYPAVIVTAVVSIVILAAFGCLLMVRQRKQAKI